ncbi:hypothetical protein N7456_002502 [Penicillium angulare]|uniref:Uncharacterized protein n=1 Tax=Penicillium angulare TaxID=116970 RepID=A0A9W9KQD5_9EURO|nr:hypothetical protein N7456_002502 [Penicillium angulare]
MVLTRALGACGDARFGPIVATTECRGGFDFTVNFESIVLSIIPAACFLVLAFFRAFHLLRKPRSVASSTFRVVTLSAASTFAALQIALVVLVIQTHPISEPTLLASTILDLLAALVIIPLVDLEHVRSIRPSFLISAYLLITVLFDLARVRTSWLLPGNYVYSAVLSTSLSIKLVLLLLASVEKKHWFRSANESHSAESLSGPFTRGLFTWLNGMLLRGRSAVLAADDLPTVHEKLLSSDLSERFAHYWARCDQTKSNALFWALIKSLRWEMIAIAFPRLCVVGFSIAQPFLIGRVVSVLEESDALSLKMSYGLVAATAIVFTGIAVFRASYEHLGYRAATMIRGGLMSLVFQHMMNQPLGSTDESRAMSLMGTDIEMLAEYFYSVACETWANVLQLALATWLLETEVGAVCIAPIIVVIVFITSAFAMGNIVSGRQRDWLQATEKRITFTSSIMGSIRNVKFLGLSGIMSSRIEALRLDELKVSKRFRRVQSIRVCMINAPLAIGQLATLAAYAIVALVQGSGGLAVDRAITSLSLISLMITPLSSLMLAIPDTFASIGCLYRIQDFLKSQTYIEKRLLPTTSTIPSPLHETASGVQLSSLSQLPPSDKDVVVSLENVNFSWKSPTTPETSGISLTLRESPTGNLVILLGPVGCGKSTFVKGLAGETPVLKGELFVKYPDIAFCDDTPWLSNSSIKDNIVGEDSEPDFDPDWYRTVVSACALDLDFMELAAGDQTFVGSKGSKLSGGQRQRIAIARAVYARRRIACFDDVLSGLDNSTSRTVFNNVFGPAGLLRRSGCTVFLATHSTFCLPQADLIMVLGENGTIVNQGSYLQIQGEVKSSIATHYHQLATVYNDIKGDESLNTPADHSTTISDTASSTEPRQRKSAELAVYKYYFSALGWSRVAVLLLFLVIEAATGAFRYVWVSMWSSSSDSASRLGYWLGIYGMLSVLQTASLILAVFWTWVVIVPFASQNLHTTVLRTCMSAPMAFLSNVDTGALVTRFSQDMRLVDMILPRGFISTGFQFFGAIAMGATTIASLPYLAATLPFLIGIMYSIQKFYLRTSSQLRLLEIELKSPLYTHFIESLAGVNTIRAFGWTRNTTNRMLSILDTAQRPYYLLLCIQRWLSLVLSLIVAGMTLLLVGLSIPLRSHMDPGLLGIALVMMMDLGLTLSELIQNWTLLETSLGAISRIKDFAEQTPREETQDVFQTDIQAKEWLTSGEIQFLDTSIAWNPIDPSPLLNKINLRIGSGQKFGLCGRTGSGKSTLALSLLRLNEIVSGQILIDGQEPFIFQGTVRENLDPQGKVSSSQIVDALHSVGVWSVLTASQGSIEEVLDAKLDESILSQGQKQLLCLARALLKKSKVLILDEPTSSLDPETDAKVQNVIREVFSGCTVIMVAHRIHTLLDFDQVAVLHNGHILEVGHPRDLLEKPDAEFTKLLALES